MGAGINVTGKLEAGRLHVGDKIVVMPAGEQGQVKGEQNLVYKWWLRGKIKEERTLIDWLSDW